MLQILQQTRKPAYEEVYQAHYNKVLQYVCRKIGNLTEAEDLTSEAFLYAYKHYEEYDPAKSGISTWLYLIVNSRLKNHYRDARVCVELESVVGVLEDDTVDLEKCLYLEELSMRLQKAIDKLPKEYGKIVRLRYFDELSCGEIAEIMKMTPGNVRVRLSRALDKLETLCSNLLEGE